MHCAPWFTTSLVTRHRPNNEFIDEKAAICKLFSIDTVRLVSDEMLEIFCRWRRLLRGFSELTVLAPSVCIVTASGNQDEDCYVARTLVYEGDIDQEQRVQRITTVRSRSSVACETERLHGYGEEGTTKSYSFAL